MKDLAKTIRSHGGGEETSSPLDELEALVVRLAAVAPATEGVVAAARARAERLAAASSPAGEQTRWLAVVAFVAETLSGLWLERRWSDDEVDSVVGRAAELAAVTEGMARIGIFMRLLREKHVLELPPRLAMEAVLGMLVRFAPVAEASVWGAVRGGLDLRVCVGSERPGRRARAIARQALSSGLATGGRTLLHGVAVTRWNEPHAALVVRTRPETREMALAYARETAVALGPLLETEALLERNAAREQSLVGAAERRLVRLGADIHDGPLQDIAALASDLRLFRSQLEGVLSGSEHHDVVLGRVDDVEARLVALDSELRDLSGSLESPGIMAIPFPELLRSEIEAFKGKTGVRVDLAISGKFDLPTASQRIALLRVVREALQNVHEHSGAELASVELDEGRARLRAKILDEGRGFDVERRLVQAARAGRLGLVGMGERIRLLGGRFDIDSQPGGPTVVTASIPRWQPPDRAGSAGGSFAA